MDKNKFQIGFEKFNKAEYERILTDLMENNRDFTSELISHLTLRLSIRVIPLLSFSDSVDFWKIGKADNRVRYLAALFGIVESIGASIDVRKIALAAARDANSIAKNSEVVSTSSRAADAVGASTASAVAKSVANALVCVHLSNSMGDAMNSSRVHALISAAVSAADSAFIAINSISDKKIASAIVASVSADLKMDLNDVSIVYGKSIWTESPEWFSAGVKKLRLIIDDLIAVAAPESDDDKKIYLGLKYLEIQAGINSENDSASAINSPDAVPQPKMLFSFEPNHEFHPENPAKIDKLNRLRLVNALATNLVNPANKHHRSIGLLGEWGSGKSTVLDLLKQRLKELSSEQPYIFGEFNAWAYEHTDNIQAGVAQEMINALTGSPDVLQPLYAPTASFFEKLKKVLSSDVRKIFAAILDAIPVSSNMSLRWFSERCTLTIRFAYKVHPVELLKILLLLLVAAMPWFSEWFQELIEFSESSNNRNSWIWTGGVFLYTLREFGKLIISPQAKELLTYLRLPSYAEHLGTIPVMRKHICTLCNLRLKQKNGKTPRLLFVVDDLDRCSPSAIVKVLEAVRLVLDLDNVIVIIAIDQHIALAALSEHFKDFSPHHKLKNSHAIAREYLSKVINLPIVLTKPSGEDVRMFMGSFWEEMNKTVEREVNESKSKLEISDTSNVSENSGVSTAGDDRLDVRNITQHASAEGDRVPGTLATDTVDLDGSEQSNAEVDPPPMMKPVKALSKDQQESFIYWVNYFDLSNSRQLKRLNNSYDLMRSYVPLMDRSVSEFEFADSPVSKVYPMLLTLILMEYLNSLHDLKERNQLWDQLFRDSSVPIGEVVSNRLVSMEFIKAYRRLLVSEVNQSLVSNVEAFVLPAMT